MELLESIRPQHSRDIAGNRLAISNFKGLLKAPETHHVIALIGPTGCGKSLICELVFKELGLKCYDVTGEPENIPTILNNKSVTGGHNKKVFLLDNLDGAFKPPIKLLAKHKTQLVVTAKSSHDATYDIIRLTYPSTKDAFAYLLNRIPDIDEEALLTLVKTQRGNIREIVLNLNTSIAELEIALAERTYVEHSNFDIVTDFMTRPSWVKACAIDHNILVAYLLYENFPDEIYYNRDPSSVMKFYANINSNFVAASQIQDATCSQLIRLGSMVIAQETIKTKSSRRNFKYRGTRALCCKR
jgi:hypothetical protein